MAAHGRPKQLMVMKARVVVQQHTSGRSLSALPAGKLLMLLEPPPRP